MKKSERVQEIKTRLIERYKDAKTELVYSNLYELLVCVMLSAQCTDKRVNIITKALFKKYPSVKELANANIDELKEFIKRFRRYDVRIAIDDFGSGYANYVHILKLKPDYLKIDGSLIKNILIDEDSQILVKSITRLAGYMR